MEEKQGREQVRDDCEWSRIVIGGDDVNHCKGDRKEVRVRCNITTRHTLTQAALSAHSGPPHHLGSDDIPALSSATLFFLLLSSFHFSSFPPLVISHVGRV